MTTVLDCDLKQHSLQLLREYQQTGKAALRNRIVELNFGLVRKEAHYWVNQCQENYDDLVQVGSIGLLNAIKNHLFYRRFLSSFIIILCNLLFFSTHHAPTIFLM